MCRYLEALSAALLLASMGSAHAQLGVAPPGGVAPQAGPAADDRSGIVIEDHPTRSDIKFVKFYSQLLGFETTTKVFIPPNYDPDGEPIATMYYLHGTCDNAVTDDVQRPGQPVPSVPVMMGPCRLGVDSWLTAQWLVDPASRVDFLIAFPDLGPGPVWCGHCWWVDGRNGMGIAAESFVYMELIPVIEQAFKVRRGRNGRAVSGKSMGASSALLHAFRHPDQWRFAYAMSPSEPSDAEGPALRLLHRGTIRWAGYLIDQGYGHPATDEVAYENIDAGYLTQNVVGTGLEVLVSHGNGCVPPESDGPACADGPKDDEGFTRIWNDIWATSVIERGVDLTYVVRPGPHNSGQAESEVYRRFFADRVSRMFATPAPIPPVVSYSTVDTAFSVWGWNVGVERPTSEFLHLSGVRTDGTAMTLAGTGVVTVTTPPMKGPVQHFRVEAARDGVEAAAFPAVEVVDGNRLRFTVDLGVRDPAIDQRRELVESGKFPFPRTRVRILAQGGAQ